MLRVGVVKVGTLVLLLFLEVKLQLFTIEYDVSCDMSFILLRYISSIFNLLIFIMNGCLILLDAFSAFIEMII